MIAGLPLESVEAFADLPAELQRALCESVEIVELAPEDEAAVAGAAVLLTGTASVCATIADAVACTLREAALVTGLTSIEEATRIRIVATSPAKIGVWSRAVIEEALRSCPWVLEELFHRGDRYSALAGATMGPLGDLDEYSRFAALERLSLRAMMPNEELAAAGSDISGLTIVGAGAVLLDRASGGIEYSAGDIVLPESVLEGKVTDGALRAGDTGALILCANRMVTLELFSILPTFVELLRVV
jgi:hypothetical protein